MADVDSTHSSYRELILEYLLVGQLLRHLWTHGCQHAEVLKSAVDDSGYDLVLDVGGLTRYIQLKSRKLEGKAQSFTVAQALAAKPNSCVILMVICDDLTFDHFRVAETSAVRMDELVVAKHTKGNAGGTKTHRPNHRVLPWGALRTLNSIDELVEFLFPRR